MTVPDQAWMYVRARINEIFGLWDPFSAGKYLHIPKLCLRYIRCIYLTYVNLVSFKSYIKMNLLSYNLMI